MPQLSKPFPLSFAQQRLWLLDQLSPGTPFYNVPAAIRLKGRLDVKALEQSFNEIVRRHESLRTVFGEQDGRPTQHIQAHEPFSLPLVDLSSLPHEEQDRELRRLVQEEGQRPFDLSRGPFLRLILFKLAPEDHALAATMHHIVSDGWSAGVLVRELGVLYEAFASGRPSPLPELPIQYVDFAVWQRDWLKGEVLEEEFSYWRERLAGLPPILPLPTDRPRPPMQGFRGATHAFRVPAAVASRVKSLALKQGTTLFAALLAAFKVLLYRYTSQSDIALGVPVANRNRVEVENLIGFFVNTVVLRSDLSGNPTFSELLRRVAKISLEAYGHQDLPFEKLVEELQPERNLSHTPLFQVMFALQNVPVQTLTLPGLTLQALEVETSTAKFDLTLIVTETNDGFIGALEYSTDLFDAATIERMSEHLQNLLAGIAAAPETRIGSLPLMSEAERTRTLVEWNSCERAFPKDRMLHQLFEDQVERTPEAAAIVWSEGRRSYRELNLRANRLAHHLRSLGVKPEMPVAICMERGEEMVVALLGIMKAGGAFLVLDPALKPEQMLVVLEDSGAHVLLTQQSLLSRLPDGAATVFCLDRDASALEVLSAENPPNLTSLESLHSIVYMTVSSTGLPIGVLTTVHNSLNLCHWYADVASLADSTRSLLPLADLDASFRSVFSALIRGGCTVIADSSDASALLHTIRLHGVTVISSPPSLILPVIDLAREDDFAGLSSLRHLHLGGEPLVAARLQKWMASENCHCTVTNLYGRIETTGVSVAGAVSREDLEQRQLIPIGRPVQNHRAYVLSLEGEPQPIGVPGELCIAGDGNTRGYLNRPELTERRFVPNPHGAPGEHVFRTGDIARWLPDGRLDYVGPVDRQERPGRRPEPREVDHSGYVAPRSRTEETLARLVGELLGTERVGVEDNFFELGGHSLVAMQFLSRVRSSLKVTVPLRSLFQAPTVAGMARWIDEHQRDGEEAASSIQKTSRDVSLRETVLVDIHPEGERRALFCVHPANGEVNCYRELVSRLGPDQPVFGLQAPPPDATGARGMEEMASAYLEVIESVQEGRPYSLAGWSWGGLLALEMARQRTSDPGDVPLFLLDPSVPEVFTSIEDDVTPLELFATEVGRMMGRVFLVPREELEALEPDERISYLMLKGRISKVLPPDLDLSHLIRQYEIFRTNVRAAQRYTPSSYPGGAVVFLPADGAAGRQETWSRLVGGPLEFVRTPGDHYSFLRPPHVDVVAERIASMLEAGQEQAARTELASG